jgi:hypothetical protein
LGYTIHLSRETTASVDIDNMPYALWRIDVIKQHFAPTSEFYICWKPETVSDIAEKLTFLWFKKIYTEKF